MPRLCRGDSKSLTYPRSIREARLREPPSTRNGGSGWTEAKHKLLEGRAQMRSDVHFELLPQVAVRVVQATDESTVSLVSRCEPDRVGAVRGPAQPL
jgi:hypothetical protein